MPNFTPGPWTTWVNRSEEGYITAAGIDTSEREAGIAVIVCENLDAAENTPEYESRIRADLALIAAAPRLYTALKSLLESQFQHLRENAPREVAEAMEALGDAEMGGGQ